MESRRLGYLLVSILGLASALPEACAALQARSDAILGTHAIQNVQTGMNLRPYAAHKEDGNGIVLYNHWKWKCMTWQFARVAGDTYRLINRYTGKTFQPASAPRPGVHLWQQVPGSAEGQDWEFLGQSDGTYLIRLRDSDLYMTLSSSKTNSPVILMPKQKSTAQRWRLVGQDPWF